MTDHASQHRRLKALGRPCAGSGNLFLPFSDTKTGLNARAVSKGSSLQICAFSRGKSLDTSRESAGTP